ncbi:WhiB family transcriptional regulator [Streptomyces sp. NPDC017936]|uniref:WhiB family transcriptional regulator n=1 Tax=Streptomyces sp. NPDC017936 TaxID=3365016 RepID=UPI003794E234
MVVQRATSGWAASEVRWQDEALCNGAPLEVFVPDKENPEGLEEARAYCNPCPVRATCLRYALTYGQRGYWGGTDTAERRRLRAKKDRVKCPSCESRRVINMAGSDDALCLACGLSWLTSSAAQPRPRAQARPAA